ncbi:hypothetical protein OLX02_04840 [Novosphingobium sp. KCTC 2891]|uniref:hypothetical protein n=1 Tax=Novosphingobium sp. KCTC 2891 TaxID=2989730 RepID=UPI0022231C6D|nr:hypothetical protein [Novosphingobium sp. KCTC 2891]MCW1382140.1 hypothetical protein [Novosphingobium sp. KCTC 2891]
MSLHFRHLAEQAVADGIITAEEVLALRRVAWPDGLIVPDEAEAILVINSHVRDHTPEWTDFVVEAIGDFVVNGCAPRGYVDADTADWLIEKIDHDGRLDSMTELELVVRVLEKALNSPERLKTYALVQIERAVVFGTGPTRDGGTLAAGCISESECRLLRRVIFAAGGDGPARVSRAEAEMLFRIKDAALGADNAPEWERLFVQGVANYLQGWQGSQALSRERAGQLEAFMNDRATHVGRFFARMAQVNGTGFLSSVREVGFGRKGSGRNVVSEARADFDVTAPERLWLDARIDADGQFDPLERALLDFLAEG